jgi:Formyl transferase
MKLAVFCDSMHRAPEFRRRFAGSGHQLIFLVCDNRGRPLRFLAAQLALALTRCPPAEWWWLVRALGGGRINLSFAPLGSPASLRLLDRLRPDLALHAMGVIYRHPVISRCGMGILNAHIGRLPKYRGRSVMEWSLLCGDDTGVSVFFIDEGIDTGRRLILFEPVPLDGIVDLDAAKQHLFAQDARLYRRAVDSIAAGDPALDNDPARGLRFYQMSDLLRHAVEAARESAQERSQDSPAKPGSDRNSL